MAGGLALEGVVEEGGGGTAAVASKESDCAIKRSMSRDSLYIEAKIVTNW